MDLDKQIAEVIETSNSEFLAQCYELDGVPAFGSMVKTRSRDCEIYALVCASGTHSIEQGRRIVARGQGAASPAEVFKAIHNLPSCCVPILRRWLSVMTGVE